MDNESILRLAVDSATTIAIQNKLFTSDELSDLIRNFYELFKELSEDSTS